VPASTYNTPVKEGLGLEHPELLMPTREADIWRIHPTWNTDGCLTYNAKQHNHSWMPCKEHKSHDATRFDIEQLFWLRVQPHLESKFEHQQFPPRAIMHNAAAATEREKTTRIAINSEDADTRYSKPIKCLTAKGGAKAKAGQVLTFASCEDSEKSPTQLFRTVAGEYAGSHYASTVGLLRLSAKPLLCVSRKDDVQLRGKETIAGKLQVPEGGELQLQECVWGGRQHRVLFEFERIN
jgi:hypothetical protein